MNLDFVIQKSISAAASPSFIDVANAIVVAKPEDPSAILGLQSSGMYQLNQTKGTGSLKFTLKPLPLVSA